MEENRRWCAQQNEEGERRWYATTSAVNLGHDRLLVHVITAQEPLSVLVYAPADGRRWHMAQHAGLQTLGETRKTLTLVDQSPGLDETIAVSYPDIL